MTVILWALAGYGLASLYHDAILWWNRRQARRRHNIQGAAEPDPGGPTDRVDMKSHLLKEWERNPQPAWLRHEMAGFPHRYAPIGPMGDRRWPLYRHAVIERELPPELAGEAGFTLGFCAGFVSATVGEDPDTNEARAQVFEARDRTRPLTDAIDACENGER